MDENGATGVVPCVTNVNKVSPACREVTPTSFAAGLTADVVVPTVPGPLFPTSASPLLTPVPESVIVFSAVEADAASVPPSPTAASLITPSALRTPFHSRPPSVQAFMFRIPDQSGAKTSVDGNAASDMNIGTTPSFGQASLSINLGDIRTREREAADAFLLLLGPFLLSMVPPGPVLCISSRPPLPPPGLPPALWDDASAEVVNQWDLPRPGADSLLAARQAER